MNNAYHALHVFDEGRLVFAMDFDDKVEAIRDSIEWQEDGFATELVSLSTAPLFDMTPDEEYKRIAY